MGKILDAQGNSKTSEFEALAMAARILPEPGPDICAAILKAWAFDRKALTETIEELEELREQHDKLQAGFDALIMEENLERDNERQEEVDQAALDNDSEE